MARVEVSVDWDRSRLNAFLVTATGRVAGRYANRIASKAKDNIVAADQILSGDLLRSIRADKVSGNHINSEWTVGTDVFYEVEVEGVRLSDFLAALVDGEVPDDVRCTVCS